MHDEEIRIIDVETDALKESLHNMLLCARTVDQVFTGAAKHDLPGDTDLRKVLIVHWGLVFVGVVKDDSHASFCYARLPTLVNEILASTSRQHRDLGQGARAVTHL